MKSAHKKTVVITVSSLNKRDKLIKRIYTNLHKEPPVQFTVVQDQVNRIRVYHNASSGVRVLIKTYLVIVVPVLVDLKSLNEVYGLVDFHLDETIKHLQAFITKLVSMQGQRIIKAPQGESLESALTEIMGDY